MAKTNSKQERFNLPGTIYTRNGRYWWKVQLPGEDKQVARPLKNIGAKFATTDYSSAVELAKNLYQQSIYSNHVPVWYKYSSALNILFFGNLISKILSAKFRFLANFMLLPVRECLGLR